MRMAGLDERKQAILNALKRETARQQREQGDKLDFVALAIAVDQALGGDGVAPGEPYDDGKEPDELNAANDG